MNTVYMGKETAREREREREKERDSVPHVLTFANVVLLEAWPTL